MREDDKNTTHLSLDLTPQEQESIKRAVADITLAWGHLENSLADLLDGAAGINDLRISSAIFFTPPGIETRLKITSNAFVSFLNTAQGVPAFVSDQWNCLMNALGRMRDTRNSVAHGQIVKITARRKTHIRLTQPIANLAGILNFAAGQLPGLSENDIAISARSVNRAATDVSSKFLRGVPVIRSGDYSTLPDIFGLGAA